MEKTTKVLFTIFCLATFLFYPLVLDDSGHAQILLKGGKKNNQKYENNEILYSIRPYDNVVEYASEKYNIDSNVVRAVIWVESEGDPNAVNKESDARGLMGLMKATAKMMNINNRQDPLQNIIAGTGYLAYLVQRFGSIDRALYAYCVGETVAATRFKKRVKPEKHFYVKRVKRALNQIS